MKCSATSVAHPSFFIFIKQRKLALAPDPTRNTIRNLVVAMMMMNHNSLICAALVVFALVVVTVNGADFQFLPTFSGDWHIEKTVTKDSSFVEGTTFMGVANFTKVDEDSLKGVLKFSGQERISSISIKSTSPTEGLIVLEYPEIEEDMGSSSVVVSDEDEMPTISIPIHLKQAINTGDHISADRFKSSVPGIEGHYTLVFTSPVTWMLTLTTAIINKDQQPITTEYVVTTFIGKKILKSPSFMENYGTTITIFAAFIGIQFFRFFLSRQYQQPQAQAQQQAAQEQTQAQQQPASAPAQTRKSEKKD